MIAIRNYGNVSIGYDDYTAHTSGILAYHMRGVYNMSSDKYGQGGKYAPHRFCGNRDYNPIVKTGPSIGCMTMTLVLLTIVIVYFVYLY